MHFLDLQISAQEFAKWHVLEKEAVSEHHYVEHDGFALVYGHDSFVNAAVGKAQVETITLLDTLYGPMYSLVTIECKL